MNQSKEHERVRLLSGLGHALAAMIGHPDTPVTPLCRKCQSFTLAGTCTNPRCNEGKKNAKNRL